MANDNNNKSVRNVAGNPLRYIVTQNYSSIKYLKESGSLIVYEPQSSSHINRNDEDFDDKYREIWVASYFLAGGYGAQTPDEQHKLSYIAANYDNNINTINNNINTYAYNLRNAIDDLNNRKVTRGINELTVKSNPEYNISYNVFDFGGENILLSELYDKLSGIRILSKLEISKIIYDVICYNDNTTYHNNDNIPINSQIKSITIKIIGNNRDSGGINTTTINLYSQNDNDPNTPDYPQPTRQIEKQIQVNINDTIANSSFQYNISIDYGDIIYKINEGLNIPLNDITLDINESNDSQNISKLPAEKRLLSNDIYGLKLYGVKNIRYMLLNSLTAVDRMNISKYMITTLTNHPIYQSCLISRIKITNQNTNNFLSVIIHKDDGRLINCEFIDYTSNNIYNINNLKGVRLVNDYYEYYWNIGNNDNFDNTINPGFISNINNNLVFNEGEFVMTFTSQTSNVNILNDTHIGNYWVPGE